MCLCLGLFFLWFEKQPAGPLLTCPYSLWLLLQSPLIRYHPSTCLTFSHIFISSKFHEVLQFVLHISTSAFPQAASKVNIGYTPGLLEFCLCFSCSSFTSQPFAWCLNMALAIVWDATQLAISSLTQTMSFCLPGLSNCVLSMGVLD